MKSLRIISVKRLGLRPVYDIEVPSTHNFVLENGAIAHNCSHAVSYAIVGYNGCWMKLNHPVHFWKGELTVHMDDHDKLREYLAECRHMVLPIDILKSDATEWVVEGDKLRPPLCLMKGCGAVYTKNLKRFLGGKWDQLEDAQEDLPLESNLTPEEIEEAEEKLAARAMQDEVPDHAVG